MTKDEIRNSRPERVLLVLARTEGDCRGKAIRFSDQTEFHFKSLSELSEWLVSRIDGGITTDLDSKRDQEA
jgi:hypothetical protein